MNATAHGPLRDVTKFVEGDKHYTRWKLLDNLHWLQRVGDGPMLRLHPVKAAILEARYQAGMLTSSE